jgi:hypothetical protein
VGERGGWTQNTLWRQTCCGESVVALPLRTFDPRLIPGWSFFGISREQRGQSAILTAPRSSLLSGGPRWARSPDLPWGLLSLRSLFTVNLHKTHFAN